MEVVEQMAEWTDFYIAVAAAASVLLGLVFIGLSFHLERNRDDAVRGLAIQSGTSLFYPLLIALTVLIPEGRPNTQAVLLGLIGLFGVVSSAAAYSNARTMHPSTMGLAFRFVLPWLAMAGLVVAAVGLWLDWRAALWLVAGVSFLHIVVGTQNAWDMLTGAGRGESEDRP
jgi:hypothetical protein